MKKIIIASVIFIVASFSVKAQEYDWAIGIRGGIESQGITVRHNINAANALEAIVAFNENFDVCALYEYQMPVIEDGFTFFFGAGGNIGLWKDKFTVGVDGIVGLEYKIQTIPLAFSIDYKPNLNIIGHTGLHAGDFALGIKVTF